MNCEKLSLNERLNILKMILYFDESGLKLSDIAGTMKIPKADVRKDLEIMSEEVKKDGIKLIYENYKGYKLTGNKGNLLVKAKEIEVSDTISNDDLHRFGTNITFNERAEGDRTEFVLRKKREVNEINDLKEI